MATKGFDLGDHVRVIGPDNPFFGDTGVIILNRPDPVFGPYEKNVYIVKLDKDGWRQSFHRSQIEPISAD